MPHFTSDSDTVLDEHFNNNNNNNNNNAEPSRIADNTDHGPTRSQRVRIKNRRNRYLELHPEYFTSPDLEIAEPLLYDRLIHRFKTVSEREAAGKARHATGSMPATSSISAFAHILESNLTRSEAKLDALQHPDPSHAVSYTRTPAGEILALELDAEDRVSSRAEGWERWREVIRRRFVAGEDDEFEYAGVDEDEGLDFWEDRERGERWVEGDREEFVGEGRPEGQTGVQDF